MENIKVSVKHNDWSEVFDMLVELGAKHLTVKSEYGDNFGWLFVHEGIIWVGLFPHERKECREVTFQQLKDMVVLKRNSIDDANAHRHDNSVHYYITADNEYFFFLDGKWACSNNDISYLKKYVKPIKENELKEFLVNHNDKWTLQLLDSDTEENSYRVAVPSGATFYAEDSNMGVKGDYFLCDYCEFRYKPKTIVVNGVEYEDEQKAVKVVQDYFKGYVK